ncbi:hypothetical protein ACXJJ3_42215 (plasmid) [Kribbella sp. WER1]
MKPIGLGYFVEIFLMTPAQKDQARRQLLAFADSNGYDMPQIFVEDLPTSPAAFRSLLAVVNSTPVAAVVCLGADALQPHHREQLGTAGVTVLIADPSP